MKITEAIIQDLPSILALQKLAYQSEAELVEDYSISPLTQTLDGMIEDFNNGVVLKAVDDGEIVGSVRVRLVNDTAHIARLIVAPLRKTKEWGQHYCWLRKKYTPTRDMNCLQAKGAQKTYRYIRKTGIKNLRANRLTKMLILCF